MFLWIFIKIDFYIEKNPWHSVCFRVREKNLCFSVFSAKMADFLENA